MVGIPWSLPLIFGFFGDPEHHETSCSTLRGQRKTTWKTHTTKGWAFVMAIRWFVLRKHIIITSNMQQACFQMTPPSSWISDPQRFQHLEAANLLLVESLVRCYATAMPWLDDPPQFDADDYWRWKIMKQKLEFVIVQVPYGATWCPIWCVGDGTNMDWTNGTNTWFCGSPIHFLPMPDWWPALRFDFPWALFHSASDSYAAGRRLWAGLSDGFQEDMVKVW